MGYSDKSDMIKETAKTQSQENERKKKRTVGSILLRCLVSTVWIIITTAVSLLAFYVLVTGAMANALGDKRGMVLCVGAGSLLHRLSAFLCHSISSPGNRY